jgi:AcrR family transcriptional regulator
MNVRKQASTQKRVPRPTAARGEQTRAALLRSARNIFARKGFDGGSVRAITRQAGTNLGAITYHFGSKRALYEEVLRAGLAPLADRLEALAGEPGTASDRLERVVDAFLDHLGANPDLPRLLLQEVASGKRPPPAVLQILQRNIRHVTSILAEGHGDGSLRKADPLLSAVSIASQPIYLSIMAPVLREATGLDLRDPATRALAAQHVKQFIRAGLSTPREATP